VPLAFVLALACLPLLPACGTTGYILRAGYEEARILWRRKPIEELLAGDLDPETRKKLELTLAVRTFAKEQLALTVKGSYSSVSRVDADQIVHLVTAAPRDRLVPYTWWFPIVGRVPYRSYFDQAAAHALADELNGAGYDTWVRPAIAFSTLGWFDDPLLSNLLRYDEVQLTDVILHELLHNTIYLPSQTMFNESFATFVGGRGAIAFFAAAGDTAHRERAEAAWADELTFSDFLGGFLDELTEAYANGLPLDRRAAFFRTAQDEFARRPWRTTHYRDFATVALNNAILLHYKIYSHRLALFEAANAHNDGDLGRTIAWVRDAVGDAPDPFAKLESALGSRRVAVGSRQ